MKPRWIVIALAVLVASAGPAVARGKNRHLPRCVDRPIEFSGYNFLLGIGPEPRPNGCAPPVFSGGSFLGQDPDPSVRHGLARDPNTGYANAHRD
jgi:hypothetical protein